MSTLRGVSVLFLFFALTFLCIPFQWVAVRLHLPVRRTIPKRYHRLVCGLIGARIKIIGTPATGGVLIAANHTSWLDIPLLSAVAQVSFVAKSEVNTWPLFGLLARLQRTIFIRRGKKSKVLEDRDHIRRRLLAGDALVIFPEGTSSDGNRVLHFKSTLLSAAEMPLTAKDAHHAPVQPVSIAYVGLHGMPMGRENRPFFAWYGDMDLMSHMWEAFKTGPFDVVIEFHKPLTVDDAGGRKQLAAYVEGVVRAGVVRALTGTQTMPPAAPDEGEDAEEETAEEEVA